MTNTQLGYIILTPKVAKEEEQWTGECLELGTATYGDTLDEVQRELRELVMLHLNGLEDIKERERFFRDHNIPIYPTPDRLQSINVNVGPNVYPEVLPVEYSGA